MSVQARRSISTTASSWTPHAIALRGPATFSPSKGMEHTRPSLLESPGKGQSCLASLSKGLDSFGTRNGVARGVSIPT
eukprot:1087778-Pyramimonas_sp.AAC.1